MNQLEVRFFAPSFGATWIAGCGVDEALLAAGVDLITCHGSSRLAVEQRLTELAPAVLSELEASGAGPFSLHGLLELMQAIVPRHARVEVYRHACEGFLAS